MKFSRLFLNKLIVTLIGFVFFFVLYLFGAGLFGSMAMVFESLWVRSAVAMGIPILIILALICPYRAKDSKTKKFYLEHMEEPKFRLKKELIYLFTFPELYAEIAAFVTIVIPFIVAVGILEKTPPMWLVIACLLILLMAIVPVVVVDVLIWMIVHARWLKDARDVRKKREESKEY